MPNISILIWKCDAVAIVYVNSAYLGFYISGRYRIAALTLDAMRLAPSAISRSSPVATGL